MRIRYVSFLIWYIKRARRRLWRDEDKRKRHRSRMRNRNLRGKRTWSWARARDVFIVGCICCSLVSRHLLHINDANAMLYQIADPVVLLTKLNNRVLWPAVLPYMTSSFSLTITGKKNKYKVQKQPNTVSNLISFNHCPQLSKVQIR